MENKIGIIWGSGVYQIAGKKILNEHKIETPYGQPSDSIFEVEIKGIPCLFLPRHGRHNHLLSSEINFCANIYALKKLGVRYLVSLSEVGSLKEEIFPRHFVIPHQFIDWTKGIRRKSFFGEGIVGNISNALPVNDKLSQIVAGACEKLSIHHNFGGSYVCIEGPQYPSIAESKMYKGLGADIIGMDSLPEAYLAKEAAIQYCSLGMVRDYDSWWGQPSPFETILENLQHNQTAAKNIVVDVIEELIKNPPPLYKENQNSILTSQALWSKKHKEILETLLK